MRGSAGKAMHAPNRLPLSSVAQSYNCLSLHAKRRHAILRAAYKYVPVRRRVKVRSKRRAAKRRALIVKRAQVRLLTFRRKKLFKLRREDPTVLAAGRGF